MRKGLCIWSGWGLRTCSSTAYGGRKQHSFVYFVRVVHYFAAVFFVWWLSLSMQLGAINIAGHFDIPEVVLYFASMVICRTWNLTRSSFCGPKYLEYIFTFWFFTFRFWEAVDLVKSMQITYKLSIPPIWHHWWTWISSSRSPVSFFTVPASTGPCFSLTCFE